MNKNTTQRMQVSTLLKRVPIMDTIRVLDEDLCTVFFGNVNDFDKDSAEGRSLITFVKAAYQHKQFVITIYTDLKGGE